MRKNILKSKSTNSNTYIVIAFVVSFLLGLALYFISKQIVLFILSILFGISCYFLLAGEIHKEQDKKKNLTCLKELISFLYDFYFYTSMAQSYKEGFDLAYENMDSSHLKDKLTDFKENHETTLPLKCLNSRDENLLIDMIQHSYYTDEEVSLASLETLKINIQQYEKDNLNRVKEDYYYLLPLLWLFIYIAILVFRLFFK